jgi:four helix bundle protein
MPPQPPDLYRFTIMQRFTDLRVWQRSHALVLALYELTDRFPRSERFGLVSQLRRAAVSVPTNIAEGSKRRGAADYARFLNLAEGSLAETEYLILLSRDLGYATNDVAQPLLAEVSEIARMLHALRTKVDQGGAGE